jgi:hypothetical protein
LVRIIILLRMIICGFLELRSSAIWLKCDILRLWLRINTTWFDCSFSVICRYLMMQIAVDRMCMNSQSSMFTYRGTELLYHFGISIRSRYCFFSSKWLFVRLFEVCVQVAQSRKTESGRWWSCWIFNQGQTVSYQAEELESCEHFSPFEWHDHWAREMKVPKKVIAIEAERNFDRIIRYYLTFSKCFSIFIKYPMFAEGQIVHFLSAKH